jgi:WD40 repeat protein
MNAIETQLDSPFYVTGGTLSRDALCYVTRQADNELYDCLRKGSFSYVLTARQMGKSSLMVRTASRLRDEGVGVVVLDLTAIGQNLSAEQWYGGLLTQMAQQLGFEDELEEFWDSHSVLGPLQRWMQAVRRVVLPRYPSRVVIFIDEIDAVRSLPFSTDEFFAGIREFYNHRTEDPELERLSFCLLGVAAPSDLIRDTRMTPFNIGQRIELHDFSEAEAQVLAFGLGAGDQEGAFLLRRILYWTGGHPYLTQRLCQAVSEANPQFAIRDPQAVDRLCGELFFARRAREQDDNLLFVRERMLRSEVELAGLLSRYEQVHRGKRVEEDETNPLISVLRLSGIMRAEGGRLLVRNRIYERVFDREWIAQNMPDAEVRRQRAAYRKGLLRATAVAALILAVIAALSFAAVRGRQQAVKQQQIAEQETEKAEQQRGRAEQEAVRADRNAQEVQKALSIAEQQRQEALNQQGLAEEQKTFAEEQRDLAEHGQEVNRQLLYAAQMNLAGQAWEDAGVTRMVDLLNNHVPKPGQQDLRGFEWYHLWGLGHGDLRSIRHGGLGVPVKFFPDNRRFVTGGSDHLVKVWDVITGEQLMTLSGHAGDVLSVAVSPDGQMLASASVDKTAKIWDAATGQEIATLNGHQDDVGIVVFAPDGRRLATASSDKTVKLWDAVTWRELATLAQPAEDPVVAFSPDGKTVATGCSDRVVRLWDPGTGRELRTFKVAGNSIYALAFSPDGATLVTGGGNYLVEFWNVATAKPVPAPRSTQSQQPPPKMIRAGGAVLSASFSPDGGTLAIASYDRTVKLYSSSTLQLLNTFKGHALAVDSVAFSRNGRLLATGGRDGVAKLWDVGIPQEPGFSARGILRDMAFSPDGCCLATAEYRQSAVKLWDVKTREELRSFDGHKGGAAAVAFSPDGQRLVTGSFDEGAVKLWDVATGREILTFKGHTARIQQAAFSPDGHHLATGSADKTVKLWDAATGQELATFNIPVNGLLEVGLSVMFSPDGHFLAAGSDERTVRFWDVITRQEAFTLRQPKEVTAIAFSPDRKTLAVGLVDGQVRLWDLSTRKEILTLKGHVSDVSRLVFFPDGRRLASGGGDNTVKIWDVATGQELISFRHTSQITALAVSSDGQMMASGGSLIRLRLSIDPATSAESKTERLRSLVADSK